jgi:hypothetical protein
MRLQPAELAIDVGGHGDGDAAPHWGAVHPPSAIGDGQAGDVQAALEPAAAPEPPAAPAAPATPQPRAMVAIGLLAACAIATLLALRPTRRPRGRQA